MFPSVTLPVASHFTKYVLYVQHTYSEAEKPEQCDGMGTNSPVQLARYRLWSFHSEVVREKVYILRRKL
jgi:hypothetical protein